MRRTIVLFGVVALAFCSACQKQQTEEERKAQIEREVQDRLAAEHQSQEQEQLARREADLKAREKALADAQTDAASRRESPPPAQQRSVVDSVAERQPAASYDLFYTRLEPYGSWLETRDYGYVWQPRDATSSRWRPYLNGHWVYTDAGWTWASEEPFGWATYHYGRWTRLRNVGWIWVPGDEWAPAWVSWRKGDDYVGWAPLPPEARFDRRAGIHNWADNYYDIGPNQYCFVSTPQFGAARLEQTIVPAEQNVTIINRTTNVTNITYNNVTVVNQGPNYEELRARTQQPIPRFKLERQVTVNAATQPSGPVVRGEAIQMEAPVIERAQRANRPRGIRQNIAQSTADHGWADVGDTEAGRQARAKMKSEATPPSDAPSKTFVRPDTQAGTAPKQSSSLSPANGGTSSSRPTNSQANTPVPTINPAQSSTPVSSPERKQTPVVNPPSPTITPIAQPTASQTATTSPAAAPPNSMTPQSPASADNERPRAGGRLKSQARRLHPPVVEPMPTASAQPSGSPSGQSTNTPSADSAAAPSPESQSVRQRPPGMRRRPNLPPRQHPDRLEPGQTSSPGASSPAPSSTASPTP
jgi:hypothetical protein